MTLHHFELEATWPGGRNNVGNLAVGNLQTKISIPPEMDGPGIGTNPDEMLLGVASTCFLITLAAMLERAGIDASDLALTSTGMVDVTNGIFTYKKIVHRPTLTVDREEKRLAERIIVGAEKSCMISKAIKGNVDVVIESELGII